MYHTGMTQLFSYTDDIVKELVEMSLETFGTLPRKGKDMILLTAAKELSYHCELHAFEDLPLLINKKTSSIFEGNIVRIRLAKGF